MSRYEDTQRFWIDKWARGYDKTIETDGSRKRSKAFVEIVAPHIEDATSLCELGVGNGRNIHYFHERFSGWAYAANDINPTVHSIIGAYYPDVLDYTSIVIMDTLGYLKQCRPADVMLTNGHLMHIPDDIIGEVCGLMEKMANKHIVIYEAYGHYKDDVPRDPRYRFERDYADYFTWEIKHESGAINRALGRTYQLRVFEK